MTKKTNSYEYYVWIKNKLCEKYDKKCITKQCPMRKVFCYDEDLKKLLYNNPNGSRQVKRILNTAAKENGWEWEEK